MSPHTTPTSTHIDPFFPLPTFHPPPPQNPGSMFGFTRFTPLTDEEFAKDRFHGSFADTTPLPRLATSEDLNRYTTDATTRKYAGELDRRRDLAASHVKHNGECAVSGLFAAVGAIEGALAGPNRADGPAMLHPLSEQWTLSCAHTHTSCTCTDSTKCSPASVLKGILQAGAILPSEESYGYETPPSNLPCKPEEETRQRAKLLEVLALPLDTDFLKRWINFRGPFAASFTGLDQWKMYQEGTMRSSCNAEQANGEASGLVVGYGSDPNGPYWVVKMSWGSSWGMHGTIRLDMNGNCLLNPTAATVDPVKPASEPVFDPIPEEEDL